MVRMMRMMSPRSARSLAAIAALAVKAPTSRTAPDIGVPSTTGLVVSDSAIAAETGASLLRAGGNAVAAAVATAFALAVTHPGAGSIGGGGYMLVRLASGRAADHGSTRRPNDHEHRLSGRAERHRIRDERARGGRRAADRSRVAARTDDVRGRRDSAGGAGRAAEDGAYAEAPEPPGDGALGLRGSRDRHGVRRERPTQLGFEGSQVTRIASSRLARGVL